MAHPVVHFEIHGPDDRRLAEFYTALFGWRMQPVADVGYTLIDTGAAGINGGIERAADDAAAVTFYIEADDLQAVLDKINLVGGKTVTPITELPGMATYALFEDLDGLVVGLVLGAGGTAEQAGPPEPLLTAPPPATEPLTTHPVAAEPAGTPVDWFEVLGTDAARSQRFYAEIFGWQVRPAGRGYCMVDTGTRRGIQGGIGGAAPGPWVTVYANVPDVAATLDRAAELGGSPVHGPSSADGQLYTGALRDPAGNILGVYHRAPAGSVREGRVEQSPASP